MSDHDAGSVAQSTQDNPTASSKDKLKESAKMLKIVEAFEAAYAKQKENYNQLDQITMNTQITVKSLMHCIKFNKKNLEPEDPNWDHEDFEAKLKAMDLQVTATNTAYAGCKKEEMKLSEQIINKDTSAMKLAKVEKIKKQQDDFYTKIDDIDDGIYKEQKESNALWDQYENFNEALFKRKLDATTVLIEQTADLSSEVNESLATLQTQMDQVLIDQKIVEPFTDDQKKFYSKISKQIAKENQLLKDGLNEMQKEEKKEVSLAKEHEECQDIVEQISKMNELNDLVHLAKVTERLQELCENYNEYFAMHQRHETLLNDKIKPAQENIKVQEVELAKFIADVKAAMKKAFNEYMKKIQNIAKKNGVETEAQDFRLRDFEERNIEDPVNTQNIPHSDVLYLKKEVARYDISVAMVISIKDSILEQCTKIDKDRQDKENEGDDLILMGTIDTLKGNLATLDTQQTMEIPRIIKNIDQLEAYLVKNLKTKLNEDNKASQGQIAAMTQRFDDYTKYITTLNEKVASVRKNIAAIEESFNDEDKEKENQFRDDLTNACDSCDLNINGEDRRNQDAPKEVDDGGLSESKLNLTARKKLIIGNTNKLVNTFNDNNKLIKESNISPKTDVQIHEIIIKNTELQKYCAEIDNKVTEGNDKGKEIENRLEEIDKTTIPTLERKYTTKNETIDECDQIFDQNEAKVNSLEETLKQKTAAVDQVLAQILAVSPLTNPALPNKGNEAFTKQVADLVGRGHDLRDEFESIHKRLIQQQDKLMDDIQPLNELGDRVVTQEEVVEIMEKMKVLSESFNDLENSLKPFIAQLDGLMKDVDACIDSEKAKNSGIANEHLNNLDAKIAQMIALKTEALKKLKIYNEGIIELKNTEGQHCAILLDTLSLLTEEAKGIEDQIHDLEASIAALNDKIEEHKATANDSGANPQTFTPKQIEELHVKLEEDTHKQADAILVRDQAINDDLDRRIEELKYLKANNGAVDNLKAQARDLSKQLGDQLDQTQDILSTLPKKIEDMMKSLQEMKNDTEPDKKTADYFEKKKLIDQQIKLLTAQKKKTDEVQAQIPGLDKSINDIKIRLRTNETIDSHSVTIDDFNKLTAAMNLAHQNTLAIKEAVENLRKEMGDCQIPANIQKRASELNAMQDLLNKIHDQFKAFKGEHRTNLKENEYEQEIKSIIETMIAKIDEQEVNKRELNKFQKNTLEKYQTSDFMKNDNDPIIVEVREHKENIRNTLAEIEEAEKHFLFVMESKDKFNELNDLKDNCDDALDEIHKILETCPEYIIKMLSTLEEMLKGSKHLETDHECEHAPDYFDHKDKILMNINTLKKVKASLDGIDEKFTEREDSVDALITKSREVDDNVGLDSVIALFKKELAAIQKMQKIATDSQATVNRIKEELGDCDIPINIGKRVSELERFDNALNEIKVQFEQLKEEDSDMDDDFINPDTEAKIRSLVVKIDKKIHGFELEQIEFEKNQKQPIETYSQDDHKSHDNANIIAEVREHKHQIQDAIDRLKDLEAIVKDAELRKKTYNEINEQADTCDANFCALLEMNGQLPKEIKDSLVVCQTMLDGSVPDARADYFELRQDIEEWIYAFKQANDGIEKIKSKFLKQQVEVHTLIEVGKKETDIRGILQVKEAFDNQVEAVDAIVTEADAQNAVKTDIQEKMAYCLIPDNITKRANEIEDFKKKLSDIQFDFFDFKIDFAKSSNLSSDSKVELKKLIDQIDSKLFNFDEERKSFSLFQKQKLELNTTKEFLNHSKAPGIIVEIREFQAKIYDANERLKELELYIQNCKQKKGHHQKINDVTKDMEVDIGNLRDFLKNTPNDIHYMLATHEEMKLGSLDKNADYFSQKEQIQFNTNSLKDVESKIAQINEEFDARQQVYSKLKANFSKIVATHQLPEVERKHHDQKKEFAAILVKANKCRETVDYIKTTMDECEIPYTISLRGDEVEKFVTKLDRITKDFQELKQNDYEECHSDTKASIRKLTEQMIQKLAGFEDDKIDFIQFQRGTLEEYGQKNFLDIKNAPIIAEVREHKLKIYDSNWRLGELEDFLRQAKAQKLSLLKIDTSNKALGANIQNLGQLINQIPLEIDQLQKTLAQMQLASIPLKGFAKDVADYAPQAQIISDYQSQLQELNSELEEINDYHEEKDNDHKDLKEKSKNQTDVTALVNITDEFTKHHKVVDGLSKRSQEVQEKVRQIKSNLDDCTIPINIQLRKREIEAFQDKLMAVNDSFSSLQKCLHHDTEPKVMIELNDKLQGFREEQKSFVTVQRTTLQVLTKDDFVNLTKQVSIIPKIKTHKDKITDAMERLKEFGELIIKITCQQHSHGNISSAINDINSYIAKVRELLSKLPNQIDKMLKTNQEMKYGSEPDDTADYWEERDRIAQNITNLINAKNKLHDIGETINQKESDVKTQIVKSKKTGDNDTLTKIENGILTERQAIEEILNNAYDINEDVQEIKTKMSECEIPVNIAMRENEIERFVVKLERIEEDFKDLKQADEDFDGTSSSEADIKKLIKEFEPKLASFQIEKRDFNKYQQNKLNRYTKIDFESLDNAPIIIEVREFKAQIDDANKRLKDLEAMTNQLNNMLILQDIENASKLLGVKNTKLRERLEITQNDLKKIDQCGTEMDGNCSRNEEEEFIEALKDEMPDVFNNIQCNFDQIDRIQGLIVQIHQTKSIDLLQTLKSEVDDATQKVEQCEGLVNKLENEIIEWDSQKKLCRRDEELEEIDNLLRDFQNDLTAETDQMYPKLDQNSKKLEASTSASDVEDFQKLVEGIKEYISDVEKLGLEVNFLLEEKDECFEEFDNEIPANIKNERDIRRKAKNLVLTPQSSRRQDLKSNRSNQETKPNDKYYMLHVNCKYRKRIHEMLKNLRELNKKRRELEDKWGPFKRELNKVKEVKVYKAIKGDAIDELFAFHLNKHQLNLPIKRIGPGKYLFGSKQILAKIINGKLVIRVGGGYMSADEFIEQYGPMEILKMQQAEDRTLDLDDDGGTRETMSKRGGARMSIRISQGSPGSKGQPSMAEMKAAMRESMSNIKIYGTDPQLDTTSGRRLAGSPKGGSPKRGQK